MRSRVRLLLAGCFCAALFLGCTRPHNTGLAPGTQQVDVKGKKPVGAENKPPPPPPPPP
jgi:hypothetical protein